MVKRQVEVKFKRSQINRLVDILKKAGEEELISMLAPHQTLAQVQKLVLEMIRKKISIKDSGKPMSGLLKKKELLLGKIVT